MPKHVHELEWTDIDGDRVRFSWDDSAVVGPRGLKIGGIQVFDNETGSENAVYFDEEDARRMVDWLTARLASV